MGLAFASSSSLISRLLLSLLFCWSSGGRGAVSAFVAPPRRSDVPRAEHRCASRRASTDGDVVEADGRPAKTRVVIVGAGWGGLSAAHALSARADDRDAYEVILVDASPRVGGLVRDGYRSRNGSRPAEAGQHGFWSNYDNVFRLLEDDLGLDLDELLTDYAEQGQYSPRGLEAVWPVYRRQPATLPTGLAQAAFTRFTNLSLADRATALPLVAAFNEFDASEELYQKYDEISFRDLCRDLGVSQKCYEEAFEPMILTGLFAPGAECSAAAALGMAYFFVLKDQTSFDVRWCKGNVGEVLLDPWVKRLIENGVDVRTSTRVAGFATSESGDALTGVRVATDDDAANSNVLLEADAVVLAVGAEALKAFATYSPELARFPEFRRFANLRGTDVLATRIWLDRRISVPYTANACWGFDEGVGMTFFDVSTLHGDHDDDDDVTVLEMDHYHAAKLLVMDDDAVVDKVKADLDTILGAECAAARVEDAAVVRLPRAVNWYYPGSYKDTPSLRAESLRNLYFCGDLVRSRHGSWSQEKAFVTGAQVANVLRNRPVDEGVIPLREDEPHVRFGKTLSATGRRLLSTVLGRGGDDGSSSSLVDFLF